MVSIHRPPGYEPGALPLRHLANWLLNYGPITKPIKEAWPGVEIGTTLAPDWLTFCTSPMPKTILIFPNS